MRERAMTSNLCQMSTFKMTRFKRLVFALGLPLLIVATPGAQGAATPLADQPLFAASDAPGNLALVLSVEFPTAISVAHTNRVYSAATEYLGFFDPKKCYVYQS